MNPTCTSAGCYLSQYGGKITFPIITAAGLIDGINPCAISMILLLLGYIIVFAQKPEKILKLGGLYIGVVYLTYLSIGLIFYQTVQNLNFTQYRLVFDRIIGSVLLIAGLINIKDFFRPDLPIHLEIPANARPKLLGLVEKVSAPATIVLAILVTLLETPCSLPIYVGTAALLNQASFAFPIVFAYFLYYNLLFVLPLIVILFLVYRGREMVSLKDWEHKAKRWMKLSLGLLLTIMSIWLLLQ